MDIVTIVIGCLAGLTVLVSLIALLPNRWWGVRVIDLIREPLNYTMIVLAMLAFFFAGEARGWIVGALLFGILVNYLKRWPYTRFASTQIDIGPPPDSTKTFTILCANVFMHNTDHARMIAQIEKADPDVVMLTEIDQQWVDALEPLLERYDFVKRQPQDDTFGKVFASRLPVLGIDISEGNAEDTPSLRAVIQTGQGRAIKFLCVHPEAPLPGHGEITDARDRSIIHSAQTNTQAVSGGIVMGDFNDVPWSPPTSAFRKIGEWRDPRIGRGTYPTFPSKFVPLGWPLDQLFVTGDVEIADFRILPANGSDHRAVYGEFYLKN